MVFYRVSLKEGVDTETHEHHNDFINESLSKRCNGCCALLYNKNNFNYIERTCDRCYKMLLDIDFKPRNIYITWWNNCKYRVLTTFNHGQAQSLMEREK